MGFFDFIDDVNAGISTVNSVFNIANSIMGGTNTIFNSFGFSSPFQAGSFPDDPLYPYADEVLQEKLSDSPLIYSINRFIYGLEGYTPDINGYTMIFMLPPDLSGISDTYTISQVTKLISFLAVDFTPPQQQTIVGDVSGGGSGISYGTDVISTGGLQVSFIDTCTLDIFNLHKTWLDYIRGITKGTVSPSDRYLTSGEIDYATSAYVVRFKPVAATFSLDDIVYVGKAIGIFPIGLPDKEVIGRRDQNELTVLPIQYQCVDYRQMTSAANDPQAWIWDEFVQAATSDLGGSSSTSFGNGGFGYEVASIGSAFGSVVNSAFGIASDVGAVASIFGNNKISKEVNRIRGQVSTVTNTASRAANAASRFASLF